LDLKGELVVVVGLRGQERMISGDAWRLLSKRQAGTQDRFEHLNDRHRRFSGAAKAGAAKRALVTLTTWVEGHFPLSNRNIALGCQCANSAYTDLVVLDLISADLIFRFSRFQPKLTENNWAIAWGGFLND